MSPPDANGRQSEELELEQALAEVERSLQSIKDRHTQIQRDQQRQSDLKARQENLQGQLRNSASPTLQAELQKIQEQLDDLEVSLESRLFSLSTLKEPFWQAVRFGGLGLVIGWGLAFAVLQTPQPAPAPTSPLQQPR
jgi:predicted RNase H-like nuclease (RuvC/YqgF family)